MPGPAGAATPPVGPSPAVPPAQEGLRAQARVKLGQAVSILVDALGLLKEASSDEGRAIVQALKTLGPVTPDVAEGLGRAEIQSLLASASPVRPGGGPMGGPPPGMLGTPTPRPQVIS